MLLTQPQLIESVLQDLNLHQENVKGRTTPALKTALIHRDAKGTPFDDSFHYRSVIGKLNYLEKSTQPEIACAVHQCARYCNDPKQSHAEALKCIGIYLAHTKEHGIRINPKGNVFECYVDASHAGDWKKTAAVDDPDTARSRTGYGITYAGSPLVWASKLQTEIVLSSTEAEYIILSTAVREVIPLLELAKEVASYNILEETTKPIFRLPYLRITKAQRKWQMFLKCAPV